jgi:phosphate:Na+ symporter
MLLDLTNFSITNIFEHIFPGNAAAQISATHIMFNIAITIILLPCAGLLIRLTRFIMPDKEEQEEEITVYLDSRILTTPPVAVQQTEKECARLAELARKSFDLSYEAVFHKDSKAIERLEENELVVDKLTHGITKYIVKINGLDIMDYDRKVMGAMYNAIQDLERIGDRSENICEAAQELINSDVEFSDEAKKELKELFKTVQGILDDSFYMFTHQSKDPDLMESVLKAEDQIDDYTEMFRLNHIKRLSMNKCSAEAGTIFLEMLTNLERIGDHAVTVAFCIPYKRPQQIPANLETN